MVRFFPDGKDGDARHLPLPHPETFNAITPGHHLLIDDGQMCLKVIDRGSDFIEARVVVGGIVSDRKGVNLPDTVLDLSPLTEKDLADIAFGLELGVDWVAMSFVQRPSDLIEAREIIGNQAALMAKIEMPAALEVIDDIIALSDSIMVARGDLGVEIPPEEVPGRQKELIRACRMAGKPVIVATQMLDSMAHVPVPTRAEASDVATAIYDGADGVMLSQETATGEYPIETVAMMDRIIEHTEGHQSYSSIIRALEPVVAPSPQHVVSAAAADVAGTIGAKVIVAFTSSGTTAASIALKRPEVQVIGLTPDRQIARRLTLLWGAHSLRSEDVTNYSEMVNKAITCAVKGGFAKASDRIVIIAGIPFGTPGSTNNLRVVTV